MATTDTNSEIQFATAMHKLAERDFCLSLYDCCIRQRRDWVAEIISWFKVEWMINPLYRCFAEEMLAVLKDREPITARRLAMAFRKARLSAKQASLKQAYGFIAQMPTYSVAQGGHVVSFAKLIYENYQRTGAADEAENAAKEIAAAADPVPKIKALAEIPRKFAPLDLGQDKPEEVISTLIEDMDNPGRNKLHTGLPTLDTALGGIDATDFVVIAAASSCGKSVLLVQLAHKIAAVDKKPVVFYSAEMSAGEIASRMIVGSGRCRPDENSKRWIEFASQVQQLLKSKQIRVIADPRNMLQIESETTAWAELHPLGAVFVDYLQIIPPTNPHEQRERQVAEISRRCKLLAKSLRCPVVAASQLNIPATEKPHPHNVRESRAIHHDADILLLLHQEDPELTACRIAIIVGKHRQGALGEYSFWWDKPLFSIREIEFDDPLPGPSKGF